MAKYRYRIEGSRYGGELVLGEVNPRLGKIPEKTDGYELVDVVLEADDWHNQNDDEPRRCIT